MSPVRGSSLPLSRKDFETDQDVRWCPGCGDYAVLSQVQKLLPGLGIPKENFVVVSGIGCSSRFPYYVDTYGMHSIHGRAPAIATGLKLARPELSVWVVTGDGDALAIGGNHFLHLMRRNVDLKILLLNNRIYGLTKGQYSPTSDFGQRSKTTPQGSIDRPLNPVALALAAGATFVARSLDVEQAHLAGVLRRAAQHRGTAFVEIYQNCVTFNDGVYDFLTDRATRDEHRLLLEQGQPLVYGKERNYGIRFEHGEPQVVVVDQSIPIAAQCAVHDAGAASSGPAFLVSQLGPPDFPVPLGVFRAVEAPTYDELSEDLGRRARAANGRGSLAKLLESGTTWTIEAQQAGSTS
jgi:2-oxoglutarate/2-oxoacid ferredoxin oxidoreductase subunit beta